MKEILGKLHYLITLDDNRVWKRSVNQIHPIGNKSLREVCVPELQNDSFRTERKIEIDIDEQVIQITKIKYPTLMPLHPRVHILRMSYMMTLLYYNHRLHRSQRNRKTPRRLIL